MKDGMIVNVLGTGYKIIIKQYEEDNVFERRSIGGYCNGLTKEIVLCDMKSYKGWENEDAETIDACNKENLRHEIVHAFFNESGLQESAFAYDGAWAKNEEMVDWFAIQGAKIYSAWVQTHCV
jgi:hypothetical protein